MRIFHGLEGLEEISNPVLTIGTFDGVHLGHQKILKNLNKVAHSMGGESVLFTFFPHPRMVLYPDSHGVRLIQTQEEKLRKLEKMGLQNIIIVPFTLDFSRLSALEFVRDFLVNQIGIKQLVIGYDHQFGKNREGNIAYLRDICDTYDFGVTEISAKEMDEVNISSTKIRNALNEGNIEVANAFLGEEFEFHGTVNRGKGLGKTLGFPTANLIPSSELKLIPKNGVYIVKAFVNERDELVGMLNIGTNPTISEGNDRTIELHLMDFNEDLYGKEIEVRFLSRLRDEMKFDSVSTLVEQIKKDEQSTRHFLAAF